MAHESHREQSAAHVNTDQKHHASSAPPISGGGGGGVKAKISGFDALKSQFGENRNGFSHAILSRFSDGISQQKVVSTIRPSGVGA